MTWILILLAVVLIYVLLVLIGKITDTASSIKGDPNDYEESSRINGFLLLMLLILGGVGVVYCTMLYLPKLLPVAASEHGVETDNAFNITLIFTGIVFVLTHIALFWYSFRYRMKKGAKAFHFAHSNKLEAIWTIIPAIVMTILVVKGLIIWYDIFPSNEDMAEDKLVVELTAKQFQWMPRYAGMDGKFGERIIDKEHISPINELGVNWEDPNSHDDLMPKEIYLVKNRPVLFKLGALDVLHGFYLPHFRAKIDCVPGLPTQFYLTPTMSTEDMRQELKDHPEWQAIDPETGEPKWKNFKYELACTELCGRSHYAMQMDVVVVETQTEFDEWIAGQQSYYNIAINPDVGNSDIQPVEVDSIPAIDSVEVIAVIN